MNSIRSIRMRFYFYASIEIDHSISAIVTKIILSIRDEYNRIHNNKRPNWKEALTMCYFVLLSKYML